MLKTFAAWAVLGSGLLYAQEEQFDLEKDFEKRARRAVERDSFPVFDHPAMLSPAEAEKLKVVQDSDAVLGITSGDEAKCYPLPVMGTIELGNDTINGIPVAVSW